jgi:hypothetical protein
VPPLQKPLQQSVELVQPEPDGAQAQRAPRQRPTQQSASVEHE